MIILRQKFFAKGVRQFKKLRKLQGEFEMNKQIIKDCNAKLDSGTITKPEEIEEIKRKLKIAEFEYEASANKIIRENMVLDMRAEKSGLSDNDYLQKIKRKYGSRMGDIISPQNHRDKRLELIDERDNLIQQTINSKLTANSEKRLKQKVNHTISPNPILRTEKDVISYVDNLSEEEIKNMIDSGECVSRDQLKRAFCKLISNTKGSSSFHSSCIKPQNDAILLPRGSNAAVSMHEGIGHGTRLSGGDVALNPARNENYLHPNFHIRTEQAANERVKKVAKEIKIPEEDLGKLDKALDSQVEANKIQEYSKEIYGRWRK